MASGKVSRVSAGRASTAKVAPGDRAYEAHQRRLSGMSWHDVAAEVGYLDGRVANTAVSTYLQKVAVEMAPELRREALQREVDRLDALQHGCWHQAVKGDLGAGNLVLKIIGQRSKLLGLDRPDITLNEQRTILISGTEEEYMAGLMAIAAERDPAHFAVKNPEKIIDG